MNELQVIVSQEPGIIHWNFDDLKAALQSELEAYKKTAYDDDSIKDAKKDVANLRKLRGAVEDKRKEIREKCLEPYILIEQQAKELTGLIDEPIKVINERVQEYENARREKCRKKILAYMDKAFEEIEQGIDPAVAEKAKERLYDPRWENATAKEKDWKEAIDTRKKIILSELEVINKTTEEEFLEDAMREYRKNLLLADATNKVYELRQQKERILERERQEQERREREIARRAAEEAAAAARKEAEEAARTAAAGNNATQEPKVQGKEIEAATMANQTPERIPEPSHAASAQTSEPIQREPETADRIRRPEPKLLADGRKIYTIQIAGTEEQVEKVRKYIHFVGAKFREV